MRALVLGAGGQVGRALTAALPDADAQTRSELDITAAARSRLDWSGYEVVVNAAAFTDVDGAETAEGRVAAWRANSAGPAALSALAHRYGFLLVHLSTEYVFDGELDAEYPEEHPVAPLSSYGASKAAGDAAVSTVERHYLVRPTWVVGDGRNFVTTMLGLSAKDVEPTVVADQVGRLTFADDLAGAIVTLVEARAPFGTYHVTNTGEPASWAEVARTTFALAGRSDLAVTDTTTQAHFADRPRAARRPLNSVLDLARAERAGIRLPHWRERLAEYVARQQA